MIRRSSHYLGKNGKRYFDERFNEQQNFGRRWQSRYFERFCSPYKVLLDFGCGDGTILRQLPAARKIGIEINPVAQKSIREINQGIDCTIEVLDGIDTVADKSVDIVISNHSLEHVLHPFKELCEIERVLVPGGRLALVTPFDDWRQKGARNWNQGDSQNHLYTWSPLNLGNLLVEVGFQVQEVNMKTTAWTPKLFWVHRLFGGDLFAFVCYLTSRIIQRREVFAIANKPD